MLYSTLLTVSHPGGDYSKVSCDHPIHHTGARCIPHPLGSCLIHHYDPRKLSSEGCFTSRGTQNMYFVPDFYPTSLLGVCFCDFFCYKSLEEGVHWEVVFWTRTSYQIFYLQNLLVEFALHLWFFSQSQEASTQPNPISSLLVKPWRDQQTPLQPLLSHPLIIAPPWYTTRVIIFQQPHTITSFIIRGTLLSTPPSANHPVIYCLKTQQYHRVCNTKRQIHSTATREG